MPPQPDFHKAARETHSRVNDYCAAMRWDMFDLQSLWCNIMLAANAFLASTRRMLHLLGPAKLCNMEYMVKLQPFSLVPWGIIVAILG